MYLLCRAWLDIVSYRLLIYVIYFNCASAHHVDLCSLVSVLVSLYEIFFQATWGFFIRLAADFLVPFSVLFHIIFDHSTFKYLINTNGKKGAKKQIAFISQYTLPLYFPVQKCIVK